MHKNFNWNQENVCPFWKTEYCLPDDTHPNQINNDAYKRDIIGFLLLLFLVQFSHNPFLPFNTCFWSYCCVHLSLHTSCVWVCFVRACARKWVLPFISNAFYMLQTILNGLHKTKSPITTTTKTFQLRFVHISMLSCHIELDVGKYSSEFWWIFVLFRIYGS